MDLDSRGRGGPLVNVFLRAYFDVFPQSSRFNFRPSKQSSFYVLGVLYISRGRGPLINVFLRVYFDVFRQSLRFNFHPLKQSPFYVFGFLLDSRGDPDKRVPEGLFDKVCVLIFAPQNRVRSMFLEFL